MANCTCTKCQRSMKEENFYTYKDGTKVEMCKQCLTMHIDNFDPSSFLWLLEKMNVPYIPEEWNVLRDRAYAKDPSKMNGMSVFGKYISKMKLKQWKDYTWADSERLQREAKERNIQRELEAKKEQEKLAQDFKDGKITEAQYRTMTDTAKLYKEDSAKAAQVARDPVTGQPLKPNQVPSAIASPYLSEEELGDMSEELTHDDKIYLALKWGRLYKPDEWISLEKSYKEMKASFDIQDADTENTLLLLCKINLKLNQCIDNGDLSGASSYSKMYDSLRKSAKFTAAQNKDEKAADFDAIGCIVAFCEKEGGFIEEYCTDTPKDDIDTILEDNHSYLKTLISDDPHIVKEIEDYAKKLQALSQMKEDGRKAKEEGLVVPELSDTDHLAYYENLEQQILHDQNITQEDAQ